MQQRFFRAGATSALVLALASAAFGQTTNTGAITGTVLDPSGAATPNASISILNTATNAVVNTTADGNGFFNATQLQPGNYIVTIKAAGFSDYRAIAVQVLVGQSTTLHPALAPASAGTETVTVSAAAPLINTVSPDFTANMTYEQLEEIPINGRRWSDLVLLTPGVTSDSNGFGLLSVRGQSPLLNNVEIDGADDNQAYYSEERGRTREGYSTPQVAIQEFQVNTGVYGTEFGRATGAVVNSVTKSGGNKMHGELYFFDRDNDWGAENPFTKLTTFNTTTDQTTTTQYKPKDWRKQTGFGVGGPLIHDKLFWFYSFDAFRRNFPGLATVSSPAAFFAAPSNAITSCPTSTAGLSSATIQACSLQKRLALPSYGAAVNLYNTDLAALTAQLGNVPRYGDQDINMPKLDWQVNSRNHVSFLYNRLRWDSPGGVQTQATNFDSIDGFGQDFVKLDYGLARLDTLITDNITNEVRFQYGRELDDESNQPQTPYDLKQVTANSPLGFAPTTSLQSSNGFTNGPEYYGFRQAYPDERKWQAADTVTWVHGQHSMKFGGDLVHNYDQINTLGLAAYAPNGEFSYTYLGNYFADLARPQGTCTANAGQTNVAGSFATGTNAIYPCYSSFGQNFGQSKFQLATLDYGVFFQDDWKATQRLTVDLGIRYDYESTPGPYKNLLTPTGSFTPLAQESNHPEDKNNIGPRVGFSWDTFGTGKTVLRGGWGMYYGRIPNAVILTAYSSTGSPKGQIGVNFNNNYAGAPQFPNILPSDYTPTTSAAANVQYLDKNLQNPQAMEYDLTLQQQFGSGTVFSLSYLASQGRELTNFINENLLNTAALANNTNNGPGTTNVTYTVTDTSGSSAAGANCGPLTCGAKYTAKIFNNYINQNFQGITRIASNINSNYNAAVFQVQNNSFRYATFNASYTWSHSLDYNQNQSTQASINVPLDPYAGLHSQYGNSNFNVPNRFVGYALFKYPDFFRPGIKHLVLDGWNLNPLVQMQSGLPYSLLTSGRPTAAAKSTDWNGSGGTAFIPVIGRNTYTYRRDEVMDIRAQKDVKLPKGYTVQLIGECFNLFNHENYTTVNTTGYLFNTAANGVTSTNYAGPQTYNTNLQYNPSFGQYTNANSNYAYSPRQVQIAAKLTF